MTVVGLAFSIHQIFRPARAGLFETRGEKSNWQNTDR